MFGLFNKFKKGLSKTGKKLFGAVGSIFGLKQLDEGSIESLEQALYEADFGVETTNEVIAAIKDAYKKDKTLRGQEAAQIAASVLRKIMDGSEGRRLPAEEGKVEVICLLGTNGVGKTTTAGKLAARYQSEAGGVLLAACDTFRAAANEQINKWAQRLNIPIVSSQHGADAASVAFDAYQAANSRNLSTIIIDTAGRLHTKGHLMAELAKIKRVLQKYDEKAPHHSWLVVDGSLGANSIEQARVFHKDFGLTGLIVTKLDGTSRGGAIVGIYRELGIPIYYVGLGEQAEDLQAFSVDNYLTALFDLQPSD